MGFLTYNSNVVTVNVFCIPEKHISDECGGQLTAFEASSQLVSPGFSTGKYPNSLNCTWNIVSLDGGPVFLSFNIFNLEGLYQGQCVDSVTVIEGTRPPAD